METVKTKLINPFRSTNGHFGCYFRFNDETLDRGTFELTFLKSNNFKRYEFEIDSTGRKDILRIKGFLVKRAENDGFDGAINKSIDDAIYYLKYGISDLNAHN